MTATDLDQVCELNSAAVPAVSEASSAAIESLLALSGHGFAVVDEAADAAILGFIVAFDPGSNYASENYRYFEQRGSDSLYIDRVVVREEHRGLHLGQFLYAHAFALARAAGREEVTCEVNIIPPNPGSMRFHARLGFAEVGQQETKDGTVRVALLAAGVARESRSA
ncbi:MAG: GNAT family N-acetyltransferase [Microbacteriaceae bacterium]|nr:GNAT family N-acetyltransferase [Microbacteriaceae bacterium]